MKKVFLTLIFTALVSTTSNAAMDQLSQYANHAKSKLPAMNAENFKKKANNFVRNANTNKAGHSSMNSMMNSAKKRMGSLSNYASQGMNKAKNFMKKTPAQQ